MSDMTKVVLDTMGGDNSPYAMVEGAVNAVKEKDNIFVYLVGPEDKINEELEKYTYDKSRIEVVHAPDEITCHDAPVNAIRQKKESSMVVGLRMVKEGKADGIVSSGNSGALLVGGQVLVGKMKGIERAPLAPVVPTMNGVSLLIDCGANVDAKPSNLVQFAKMGSIYVENVCGVKSPKVGILNIGAEEEKGNALVKETFPLLKNCPDINFIGSIEARDVPLGLADVIVCEAFAGNVALKMFEGAGSFIMKEVKKGLMSSFRSKIGALLIKPALKDTLKKFDLEQYGGAPMLGLKGLVVKTHGSSKSGEIKNSVLQCVTFHEQKINEKIKEKLCRQDETEEI